MNKPVSTLFMLMSVDGKISTGSTDNLDIDTDFPRIKGIKEGLQQYYDIEQTTDLFSLNSGRVLSKIGANKKKETVEKSSISFLIIDNKPHLNETGVDNLIKSSKNLFIITTNKKHPAFSRNEANLEIIYYDKEVDFEDLFVKLKNDYDINNLTVQTGGTLNSILLKHKLINKISIIIAPSLIGGKETASLIDGNSFSSVNDLKYIKALKLTELKKLDDSYIHLKYDVINDTIIL